jgi:epoxide hydrolase-like predicted phosphatase
MATIKAVIFDWGGVLIDDPEPALIHYCSEKLGVGEKEFDPVRKKYMADFDRGALSEEHFWERIAGDLNVPAPQPPTLWIEAFAHVYSPREEIFALAQRLQQAGYHIGFLSNTEPPNVGYFEAQHYHMFDTTTFSCLEGLLKPGPEIYQRAIAKAGLAAEEIMYLDDNPANVEGAKKVGLDARLVKTVAEIQQALAGLL